MEIKDFMIDAQLLQILACPEDKSPVKPADAHLIQQLNAAIAAGTLNNRGGAPVKEPLDGGLIRQDGKWLYPIREDIPVMLVEEAIPLSKQSHG